MITFDANEPLYFEDVVEGQQYVSGTRLVREADLLAFTEISGDRHPIHTDDAFAQTTIFGQRILHGPFGIAVALGLFGDFTGFIKATIALTDVSEWRFMAPIFIGDGLALHMTIEGKKRLSAGDRGIIQRRMVLKNHHGKIVQQGAMGLMMWCRNHSAVETDKAP
jgi:acyl dehydratase